MGNKNITRTITTGCEISLAHITAHYLPKPSRMTYLMAEMLHNLELALSWILLILCNAVLMFYIVLNSLFMNLSQGHPRSLFSAA